MDTEPLAVSVLGAGPAGSAMAALAASRGHNVALWSPRGGGTRHVMGRLATTGALAGNWPVRVAADLGRALEGVALLLVCLPAPVLPALLRRLAPRLAAGAAVVLAPPGALGPLLLRQLAPAGLELRLGCLVRPPMPALRLTDGGVRILAPPEAGWLAALTPADGVALAALCQALFGQPPALLPDLLCAALAEQAGLAAAARLLAPSGVEDAEPRLFNALLAERDSLAAALGRPLPAMPAWPVAMPLAEAGAALAFLEAMGRAAHLPLPLIASALRLLGAASGQSLSPHPVLAELDPAMLAQAFPTQVS